MIARNVILGVALGLGVGLVGTAADADWQLSVYGGDAYTFDSDVSLSQPGGFSGTFDGVSWDAKSFQDPPYYGIRLTYWDNLTDWGAALDFTHAKTYASLDDTGFPGGALGNTFNTLEFSDGLNLLTVNAMRRWDMWGPITPYAGIGAGLSIPHVEVDTGVGPRTFEYQVAGFAAQALVGGNVKLAEHLSMFTEYKLSYAGVDADLDNGGSLSTDLWTNHFILGLSLDY